MSGVTQWEPDEWTAQTPTLFAAIARYRYVIAAVVVAAVVLGYLGSSARHATYEATNTIFLSESAIFGDDGSVDPSRKVQQEASRLESRSVFQRAAKSLGGELTRERLIKQITIEPDTTTGIIEVTGNAGDPQTAADIANSVTQAYEDLSRQSVQDQVSGASEVLSKQADQLSARVEELQNQVDARPSDTAAQGRLEAVQSQLLDLQSRISAMTADAALYGSGVSDVEKAVAPLEPTSPKPKRDAALAGLLALALASATAYWRAGSAARARIDTSELLGAPLLAQIPEFRRSSGGTAGDPLFDPEAAEAYQFLLSSFEYAIAKTGARSILVTSVSPGDGKSLTALHLARALAIQGREVVLVDSDIRAHGLTTLLRADGHSGLVSMADGEDLEGVVRRYRISNAVQLAVVPAGRTPSQPTGLLATARYRNAITRITTVNDLSIIDGSPLLTVADASAVAMQVDAILLVIDTETADDELVKVSERLRLISTPLLGYVVNRVPHGAQVSSAYGRPESTRIRRLFGSAGSGRADVPDSVRGAATVNGHRGR